MREQASSQARPAAAERRRSLVPAAAAVLGLALVVAVAWGLWTAVAGEETATGAPQEIAGYRLQGALTGSAAVASMQRLHGEEIDIVTGWIARYEGGGTIWLAEAADEGAAGRLLQAMTDRIADGNESFSHLQGEEYRGLTVYSVLGQGQRHYYYARGRQLVWVATPPGAEEAFFSDALEKMALLDEEYARR